MSKLAFTYDDVLIRPAYSDIESRSQCDTSTYLTEGIKLNIPILAANMDTVCEANMAIRMALLGGVGVIHRYLAIEDQEKEIRRVKRDTSFFRETFYSLSPDATVKDYKAKALETGVKSFPVLDAGGNLLGIVTRRDVWGLTTGEDDQKTISAVMTSQENLVSMQELVYTEAAALEKMEKHKIEQLPILYGAQGHRIKGLVSRKDLNHKRLKYPNKNLDANNTLLVGAAVGVKLDPDALIPIISAGVNFLVVDIAHGHHTLTDKTLSDLKQAYPDLPVIIGNVTTRDSVERYKNKADGIKMGVGGGSACRTRVVTGCGMPMFTAVRECAATGYPYLIADGGITNSGDIVKALFAGASSVMIGGLLAGTSDSPGRVLNMDGRKVKQFRGMASHEAYLEKNQKLGVDLDAFHFEAEGASGYVNYKGETEHVVNGWLQGVRSGMSYCGAHNIKDLQDYGLDENNYHQITPAGVLRAGEHHMKGK